ncbi:hypothetical protein K438DRAFT_1844208 [Mycena galopus ATCC 62051]|nr:hypothetical protein K438DRAFT_1844208 [Mycena galopus ATCC 62051]
MQGLTQPPDQPSVDGCPVVELAGDTIIDVGHLLKALYTPTFLLQKALPFPVVAALIRLGRKYDFKDLLDTAVERFMFENPTTLEEYDALRVERIYQTTRILPYPGIVYDMLTVARENSILSALPCAYYRASGYYAPKYLFDGVSRGDMTKAFLAPVDQRRCVLGHDALIKAQFQDGYTLQFLYSVVGEGGCADPPKCKRARAVDMRRYGQNLGLYALCRSSDLGPSSLCVSCQKTCDEMLNAGRKKVWEELPKFFDLPPWAESKNDL